MIVDLSAVTPLSSLAIRSLILNAKAPQQLGGRMVLVAGNNASVSKTLQSVGIDVLTAVFQSIPEAERALRQ